MSQENVELVKQGIDAFNRRDVDKLAELVTKDFEGFPGMMGAVEGDSAWGRDRTATYFEAMSEAIAEGTLHAEEIRDLGNQVLVRCRIEGRGRGSGVPVEGHQTL